jgi:hypothetical protein
MGDSQLWNYQYFQTPPFENAEHSANNILILINNIEALIDSTVLSNER